MTSRRTSERFFSSLPPLFLSLLGVGAGQIYNGQTRKGLLFLAVYWLLYGLLIWCVLNSLYLAAICLVVLLLFRFVVVIGEAFLGAWSRREGGGGKLKKFSASAVVLLASLGAELYVFPLVLADLILPFVYQGGRSMAPTVVPGDYILVDRRFISTSQPRVGQVVFLSDPDKPPYFPTAGERRALEQMYVRRVIAGGGDVVEVRGSSLIVNGIAIEESYAVWEGSNFSDFGPYTVPQGEFFLLGDNRNFSKDSRHWEHHAVSPAQLAGRVLYVYWPQSDRLGKNLGSP